MSREYAIDSLEILFVREVMRTADDDNTGRIPMRQLLKARSLNLEAERRRERTMTLRDVFALPLWGVERRE